MPAEGFVSSLEARGPQLILRLELPHHLHHRPHVIHRGFRQNPVAEIEDVAGASTGAFEQFVDFGAQFVQRREEGDRVEVEFEMPLRLEPIDDQNPNNVALVQGPLALFAVTGVPSRITKAQLLEASRVSQSSDDWTVRTDSGILTFRPFAKIMDEGYRLYLRTEG